MTWSRSWNRPLSQTRGDPLREKTGIRPSLHPMTINAIAEALKLRATGNATLTVTDKVAPLQVALEAGRIAAEAIQKRQATSRDDGMVLLPEEQQTVAGRVLGVIMRFEQLEDLLNQKCQSASWIAKYNEWNSFGILSDERDSLITQVHDRIKRDPLFTLNRAECLLALYLKSVEAPELALKNATVQDNSQVDFLDADRAEVLLSSLQ